MNGMKKPKSANKRVIIGAQGLRVTQPTATAKKRNVCNPYRNTPAHLPPQKLASSPAQGMISRNCSVTTRVVSPASTATSAKNQIARGRPSTMRPFSHAVEAAQAYGVAGCRADEAFVTGRERVPHSRLLRRMLWRGVVLPDWKHQVPKLRV